MYTIYHRNALVEKYSFFVHSRGHCRRCRRRRIYYSFFVFRNWIKRKECVRWWWWWQQQRWWRADGGKSPCKQSHHVFCLAQIFNLWCDKSHHDARVLIYWWQDWRNAKRPLNMILDIVSEMSMKSVCHYIIFRCILATLRKIGDAFGAMMVFVWRNVEIVIDKSKKKEKS